MRAVLDTVVFVRALINPKGLWGRLLFDLSDRYTIVLSPEIIEEIVAVLYRPALRKRLARLGDLPDVGRVLELFEQAEVVEPRRVARVCHDPNHDKCFACARAGKADYIVSEEKDILSMRTYRGIRSMTAREFIDAL